MIFERVFDKLQADAFFIVHPPGCLPSDWEDCLPVNPTPGLVAAFQRIALTVNPAKYNGCRKMYKVMLAAALDAEAIVPIHHSGYYSNNLLSEVSYLIGRCERRDHSSGLWSKLLAKMQQLLVDLAPHLQANLPAYMAAALYNTSASVSGSLSDAIVQATLWDFHPAPDVERPVDNHNRTAVYGPTVNCSEGCGCSTTAILVRDRPPNEFIWQIDPTKLAAKAEGGSAFATTFGGAFLCPYYVWASVGLF